jgi:hypothetical protein
MVDNLTLLDALRHLFPLSGGPSDRAPYTAMEPTVSRRRALAGFARRPDRIHYARPPLYPFDIFAISAYLLERSGAYHHIRPADRIADDAGRAVRRVLTLDAAFAAEARKLAGIWERGGGRTRRSGVIDLGMLSRQLAPVHGLWRELFGRYGREPVFREMREDEPPPEWWTVALKLLIISDEACRGVGFLPFVSPHARATDQKWFEYEANVKWYKGQAERHKRDLDLADGVMVEDRLEVEGIITLSTARADVVCVLPKSRTTAVGCTLRSLTHHLALLPPQGIARGRWMPRMIHDAGSYDTEFNVLLVPFPYSITAAAFRAAQKGSGRRDAPNFFEVDQTWIPQDRLAFERFLPLFESFLLALAAAAKCRDRQAPDIHAVIFPELSLNFEVFRRLQDRLASHFPELELLIAGISDNGKGTKGNFVAVTSYERDRKSRRKGAGAEPRETQATELLFVSEQVREKHHRWKLGRQQIEDYGLIGGLNPAYDWWEDLTLLSRRVDFTVFRSSSVIAAMICEDLARVDPCQQLLRAIGPNIVVSLLMDAPQYPSRWPARYASVLAEDPGSAVLTFTSRALMTHQHLNGHFKSHDGDDRVVGLWRDDFFGRFEPIKCPNEAHGVLLKLFSRQLTDYSLDGRGDDTSVSWHFASQAPLVIENVDARFAEVLGAEDLRLRRKPATVERDRQG